MKILLTSLFEYQRLQWIKILVINKKRKNAGIKHLNDPRAFIEDLNTMDDESKKRVEKF